MFEIRNDEDSGELDEIVGKDLKYFHLELLGKTWWIGLTDAEGIDYHITLWKGGGRVERQ